MAPTHSIGPQVFQIMLSLAEADRHGYAIIGDVRDRTRGEMRLTASTLYAVLKRLLDQKWIEELDPPTLESDSRRRYYRLTPAGHRAGRAEAARLRDLAAMAGRARWHSAPRRSRS
jgi:DNA-binding PadR family transcriptional regulator